MVRIVVAVFLISFTLVNGIGKPKGKKDHKDEKNLNSLEDHVVEALKKTILELNGQKPLTKQALATESQQIDASNAIDAKINSEELKKIMDEIKRRDEKAEKAPSQIYNKLIKKIGHKLDKKEKEFLKSAIESSVKKYIVAQEVAGTPIVKKEGETTIQELADRVVDRLKPAVLEMVKSKQLSKEAMSDKDHKGDAANLIAQKFNSEEMIELMDRIKRRDPTAEIAPSLIYDKLLQTVKGQLGDDPETAEAALKAAVEPAVKNYIVKQETIVPPQDDKKESTPPQSTNLETKSEPSAEPSALI